MISPISKFALLLFVVEKKQLGLFGFYSEFLPYTNASKVFDSKIYSQLFSGESVIFTPKTEANYYKIRITDGQTQF